MKKKLFITVLGLFFIASIMSFEESDSQNFSKGRKFWGWSEWNCSGNEHLTCCTRTHYVIWMENSYEVECH